MANYHILTKKWIKNKYALPFVILDYICNDICPDIKDKTQKKLRDDILCIFHDIVYCLTNIMKFEQDPLNAISRYDPLETLDYARCFRKIDEAITKLDPYIKEDIVITLADPELLDMCEFVPEFPKKIEIRIHGLSK